MLPLCRHSLLLAHEIHVHTRSEVAYETVRRRDKEVSYLVHGTPDIGVSAWVLQSQLVLFRFESATVVVVLLLGSQQ